MSAATFAGLTLRPIGPALISGRIVAIAVDPMDRAHYYVGAASGGVWETKNDGGTWTPVFDHEGSYSIGALAIDPRNPSVVWAGTGEANSQRSVAYGDGIYRSDDGGVSWTNVGLKHSEHIGRVVIDPKDTNTVYVAAAGPLWSGGGDRGLYKTTDAGKTWNKVLSVDDHTGVGDVAMDPEDPKILYAAAWQRERRQYT
ncbi:MAG: WD40/YVTN/BNR-like repeat-containing protein, partial [Candidatus Acidiferrales bacterium]